MGRLYIKMNRIEKKFKELKAQRKKAFIAFITAGDPNLRATPKLVQTLTDSGVDIIELGMPFSDPMADGPVIQKSSERALKAGTTLRGILQTVKKIREKNDVPVLLMGYYNPVFHFGVRKFFLQAKKSGVDGVLLVDLPPEEGEEARRAARALGISLVFLMAPTSDEARIKLVTQKGSGFIYYVSLTGITGARLTDTLGSQNALKILKKQSRLPVCIGFGIKTAEQARTVARHGNGVVVGSAFVQLLGDLNRKKSLKNIKNLSKRLARAVHTS